MNYIQISAPTVTDDGKKAKISVDVEIVGGDCPKTNEMMN